MHQLDDALENADFNDQQTSTIKGTTMRETTNEQNRNQPDSFTVVIIDCDVVRVLQSVVDVDALALHACVADDPANWDDLVLLWSRGKYHEENAEFLESLPIALYVSADAHLINEMLMQAYGWCAVDLVSKRLFSGGRFPKFRLRHQKLNENDELMQTTMQTTVMAPWWQLRQSCEANEIWAERNSSIENPNPYRKILWGQSLTEFLADALLKEIQSAERENKQWQGARLGRQTGALP